MNAKSENLPASRACCLERIPVPSEIQAAAVELAPLCKALGDPTRLQIAALLACAGRALCACELEAYFNLSQPTISHHLAVLRKAKVVRTERRGTWKHYGIHPDAEQGVGNLTELVRGKGILGHCCREAKP